MKTIKPLLSIVILAAGIAASNAEVAIIPYRVEDPSAYFGKSAGEEYAKILGVALHVRKRLQIYSPRDLELDLRSHSISPQGTIGRDSLALLGRSRALDSIIVGTLARSGSAFIAESTLFSPREGKVLARSHVRADSLFACAQREAAELFVSLPDRSSLPSGRDPMQIAFVLDASYNISKEWVSVKRGLVGCAGALSDGWSSPVRAFLLPFSENRVLPHGVKALTSPALLRGELDAIRLKGGVGGEDFSKALSYAVKNISWQRGGARAIVAVVNTPMRKTPFVEQHAIRASRAGITLHAVALGRCDRETRELLRRCAAAGRGRFHTVAYRQRAYEASGSGLDLLMESGRLFTSGNAGRQWGQGLYIGSGDPNSRSQRPRQFLSEVFVDSKKYDLSPYAMAKLYPDIAGTSLINSEPLESNSETVLGSLGEWQLKHAGKGRTARSIAKVLLSDDRVSLWARIYSKKDLEFFARRQAERFYFTLGVSIRRQEDEPYGLAFLPAFVTELPPEYIPESMTVGLGALIEKKEFYADTGLFRPPLWFIRVKAIELERAGEESDIRDER